MLCHSNIIDEIFGKIDFEIDDKSTNNQIILATSNSDLLPFNKQVLKKLKKDPKDYSSVDTSHDS